MGWWSEKERRHNEKLWVWKQKWHHQFYGSSPRRHPTSWQFIKSEINWPWVQLLPAQAQYPVYLHLGRFSHRPHDVSLHPPHLPTLQPAVTPVSRPPFPLCVSGLTQQGLPTATVITLMEQNVSPPPPSSSYKLKWGKSSATGLTLTIRVTHHATLLMKDL